jgi:hypothetical protein
MFRNLKLIAVAGALAASLAATSAQAGSIIALVEGK